MQKPNLNKIIADNLDKAKFQSKSQPSLPTDGWLSNYSNGGVYISDRAKATQFGQYKRGGGYFPEYHSFAPPMMKGGGPGDGFLGLFRGRGGRGSVACPGPVCGPGDIGGGGGLGIGRGIGEGVQAVGNFLGNVIQGVGDLFGGIGDGHRRKRKCEKKDMEWDPITKRCTPKKSDTSDYDDEDSYMYYSYGNPTGSYNPPSYNPPSYTPPSYNPPQPSVSIPQQPSTPFYGMIGPTMPNDIVFNYVSPEGNTPENLRARGELYNGVPTGIRSDMVGMAKNGGDISIPDLQNNWLTQYADEGVEVTTETTNPPGKQQSAMEYISNFAKNNPNKFNAPKKSVVKKSTPYRRIEATKANIIRSLLPVPKNAAQMISKNIFGDARMNEESLTDQEKVILWNTIQNAQKRSGVVDAGGTEYQDYGNQGYGSPEEYNQWFNRGNTTAFGTIKNSLTNPGYKLASTIGRGRYWQDPNDPNTMYYTDVYDWNPNEKNYTGNNAYQLLRNYVRGTEDKNLDQDKNENYRMNFKLTKADIERIKAGKPALSTHPEVNFHTPTFKKGGWLTKYASGGEQWLQKYPGGGLFGFPTMINLLPNSPIMKWANHKPTVGDAAVNLVDPSGISNVPFVTESFRNLYENPSWGNALTLGFDIAGSVPFFGEYAKPVAAARKANQLKKANLATKVGRGLGTTVKTVTNVVEAPAKLVNKGYKKLGVTSPILNNSIGLWNRGVHGYQAGAEGVRQGLNYLSPGTPSQQNIQVPYAPQQKYGGTWLNKYK